MDDPLITVPLCVVGCVTRDRIRSSEGRICEQPGGTAFYAGVTLASLGAPPLVITRMSEGDRPLLSELHEAGTRVRVLVSPHTSLFENLYDTPAGASDDRRQRQLQWAAPFETADLRGVEAQWWLFGPLTPEDLPPALVAAEREGRTALDLQGWLRRPGAGGQLRLGLPSPEARRCLQRVDVLKVSEVEGRVASGEHEPARMARALAALGPREVLVTLGEQGAWVHAPSGRGHVEAAVVRQPVDPTGCGDTFLSAYLWAREAGGEPIEACRLANAAASLALEQRGALRATPKDLWLRAEKLSVAAER